MMQFPAMHDQLAALTELDASLRRHDVDYWLFGGWAVDFHARRVTRAHGDIDIAIWMNDARRVDAILSEQGWCHSPEADGDGYTCYERRGVKLEVAFLARDESHRIYTPVRDGRGEWPDGAFGDDVALLGEVSVRLISRGALVAEKSVIQTDPVTAAKDRADIASLARP